jgi:hypothetical protein
VSDEQIPADLTDRRESIIPRPNSIITTVVDHRNLNDGSGGLAGMRASGPINIG